MSFTWTFTIVVESFDEERPRIDGKHVARHAMIQLGEAADVCAKVLLSGAKLDCKREDDEVDDYARDVGLCTCYDLQFKLHISS